jgi:hypothetical protein
MKTVEAKIIRAFAEVRKDLFEMQEEIKGLKTEISTLNKSKKSRK